jgi:RNA polymerase sigma factor (sigma-70 family)
MASASLVRQLGALFDGGSLAGLSDRQLIERFNGRRDDGAEAAFAALVARHGPMVLGVCRHLLGDHHLAEDAFQAAFLVLARRAHSLRDPDRLGPWLHGVALRTARKARARLARHRHHEQGNLMGAMTTTEVASGALIEPTSPPADRALLDRDQAEALHGEIDRLPDAFRSTIVLCYFEGLALDEAARRLRCPAGTLRSRLARARDKLRRALTRRGAVLSTAALAAALEARPASASVPPQLCDLTARAAFRFAARQAAPSTAAILAREVLRAMTIHKLKATALSLVLLAALAAGVGLHALGALAGPREGEPPGEPLAQAARTEPRPPDTPTARDEPRPAPGRMFVVGRVLDPDGKPVPGATVGVSARRKLLFAGMGSEGIYAAPIGHAASDASGRFRLDAPRTSSAHHALLVATAIAPGYGMGWAELEPDEDQPATEITLRPEQVVEGRLFDLQGRPVAGATVSVGSLWRVLPGPTITTAQGRVIEATEGPTRWSGRVQDGPGWPSPAKTDADGSFTLRGIGRGLRASLRVFDPRFAPLAIGLAADADGGVTSVKAVLQPARAVIGRVTYADTGRPAAGARVAVRYQGAPATEVLTDADGRYRLAGIAGDQMNVAARAPDGQPYLMIARRLEWPKGAVEQSVDLAMPRGLLLRGRVVEEGTGRPVADAMVRFGPYGREDGGANVLTSPDGSFAMPIGPRAGHFSVQAAGEDYQLQVTSNGQHYQGRPGGLRLYAHAFLPLDLSKATEPPEIRIALKPGAMVAFRILGPDGQPARDVRVFSRAVLGDSPASAVRGWIIIPPVEVAHRGHFEVHGLDPDTEVPVHFLQPDLKLGATVRLTGKMSAGGPVTVRLEPCGLAMARLVGPDGRPVTGQPRGVSVTMVVTPGPPTGSAPLRAGALAADEAVLSRVDPVNHANGWIADAQGRLTLPALIPGATYRIIDRTAVIARDVGDGPQVRREFVVGPGEAVELGDVLIQKPPR